MIAATRSIGLIVCINHRQIGRMCGENALKRHGEYIDPADTCVLAVWEVTSFGVTWYA